jgi:hypothetical protein
MAKSGRKSNLQNSEIPYRIQGGAMSVTLDIFPVFGFERFMNRLKLKADSPGRALLRGLILALIAWGPMAIWSILSGNAQNPEGKLRFTYDFAAYAQFWIGLPLLSLAQALIGQKIARSISYMAESEFLCAESLGPFSQAIARSQRLIKSGWTEIAILVAAFITPLGWLSQELTNGISTWHAMAVNGVDRITLAGVWESVVAIPLFWFLIYRWIWRIFVWFLTLYKISRLKLNLSASHPDSMGGLGFISVVQATFGILIFMFGCVIAATALYKLVIEKTPASTVSVWGMIVPFVVLGPAAFISPLLVFTPLLLQLRSKSQYEYSRLGLRYTQDFERKWIQGQAQEGESFIGSGDIQSLLDLSNAYKQTLALKIIPFDFRNMLRLVAAAFGPMIPVIIQIMPKGGWLKNFLETIF